MSGQRHSHLPGVGEDTPTAGLLPPPPLAQSCFGVATHGGPCSPRTPPAPGGQHQGFQRSCGTGRETKSNSQGLGSMPNCLEFPSLSSSSF